MSSNPSNESNGLSNLFLDEPLLPLPQELEGSRNRPDTRGEGVGWDILGRDGTFPESPPAARCPAGNWVNGV